MATLGILGGGQLARMLALAGAPLGQRFLIVDSSADACAAQFAPLVQADWRDFEALENFAERVDVATFDFENVPASTAQWLSARTRVHPNVASLEVAQDRYTEKTLFRSIGLDTPDFQTVDSRDDLVAAVDRLGLPALLKTRRLGYDGKGQYLLREVGDIDKAWNALGCSALILEAFITFEREVSVIAVRSTTGEFRHYPLTRNWHASGILSASLAPIVDDALELRAVAHARALAERLDYVGVFALELFVVGDRLLGNEMAPRVHNSGHWTIEGATCSQFENHVRAVLGMPLGDTAALGYSVMLNWIGELPDANVILAEPRAHWHDYGKSPREGRKVGHATICGDDPQALADHLHHIGEQLGRVDQVAAAVEALRSIE